MTLGIALGLRLCCRRYAYAVSVLLSFLLGLAWATVCFEQQLKQPYPRELERVSISVVGHIEGLPDKRRADYKFRFRVTQATKLDGSAISVLNDKRLLLSCYRCQLEFLPAQRWRLTVRLKRPHGFASWGAFDYEKMLFRQRVIAKGYVRIKESNVAEPNALLGTKPDTVSQWRWTVAQKLDALSLANSNANIGIGIIKALAIGDKSGLSKQQREVFQNAGVSHLMAISGLHIGLVFLGVRLLSAWLLLPVARVFEIVPRQYLVLLPAMGSAVLYSALAGFAVSTQRALTMLCVYLVCKLLVRNVSLLKVLLITVCLIVLASPWSVLDMGFWLSCGAVFIIALASFKDDQAHQVRTLSLVRLQPLLWLGMLPLSVSFFGQVSLISPIVNLVMVPLFCMLLIPATLLAVVVMQCGLGDALLIMLSHVYFWVYRLLELISEFPFSKWHSGDWTWLHWVLIVALGGSLLMPLAKLLKLARVVIAALLVGALIYQPLHRMPNEQLRVVLLDVGQGLAMVVHSNRYVMVYDTGPKYSSGFTAAEAVLIPYLRRQGITRVDTLIISHADNDHIGGYQTLVDGFPVDEVLTSRVDKLPNAKQCVAGQTWKDGFTRFSMLGPDDGTPKGSNNRSCVLRIDHFATSVLITGDIEKQVERYMLKSASELDLKAANKTTELSSSSLNFNVQPNLISADIMLVPHQGSKTSSTAEFIDSVQPKLAILAAGYRNHYGHPHPSVVERYAARNIKLDSTIEQGSILFKIDRAGWQQLSYRDSQRRFWHNQKKPIKQR